MTAVAAGGEFGFSAFAPATTAHMTIEHSTASGNGLGTVVFVSPGPVIDVLNSTITYTVAAGVSDRVILRNLYLSGQGGANGVKFLSGASLHIENLVVNGFNGDGIFVETSGNSHTFIADTTVRNNGGDGISFSQTFLFIVHRGSIVRTRAENNGQHGFSADDHSIVNIRESLSAHNRMGFRASSFSPSRPAEMTIEHSSATGNTDGIFAEGQNGGSATIVVSETTITHNGTGVAVAAGGSVLSRLNNTLTLNGTNGAFSGTVPAQ